ncbi:MAG: hypothetical protein V7K38_18330 [Nostoc sp.]|uniref:hypothetical protein n=1 Tax=Nostoc sp. TaxID=1180 RepID=UPI002FFA4E05
MGQSFELKLTAVSIAVEYGVRYQHQSQRFELKLTAVSIAVPLPIKRPEFGKNIKFLLKNALQTPLGGCHYSDKKVSNISGSKRYPLTRRLVE